MKLISSLSELIKNNKIISFITVFLMGIIQNIIANISTPDSSIVLNYLHKALNIFRLEISVSLWIFILLVLLLQLITFSFLLLFPNIRNGFMKELENLNKKDNIKENKNNLDSKILFIAFLIVILPISIYFIFKNKSNRTEINRLSEREFFLIWYIMNQNNKNISNYTSDIFYDIMWQWNWKKSNDKLVVNNLKPICPKCNYELKKGDYIKPSIDNKIEANENEDKKKLLEILQDTATTLAAKPHSYVCNDCGFYKKFDFNISNFESKIKNKIWQQIRIKNLK